MHHTEVQKYRMIHAVLSLKTLQETHDGLGTHRIQMLNACLQSAFTERSMRLRAGQRARQGA